MNILMITPGIDPEDEAFGFVYPWITRMAAKVNKLVIITPRPYSDVPTNVKVIYIKGNKISKFFNLQKAIYSALKNEDIDLIFTHMYLEFPIISWPYAKLFHKPMATWYEHSSITFRLRLVNLLSNKIFSASKQGFQLASKKHVILGHGIDTEHFRPADKPGKNILSVSRISRSKNISSIIDAYNKINPPNNLVIIGSPVGDAGREYLDEIKQKAVNLNMQDKIIFAGGFSHAEIASKYNSAGIFINTSHTGSMDKAGLEAMSSGLLLLTTNNAFADILGGHRELLLADESNLAYKLAVLLKLSAQKKNEISNYLRHQVVNHHSIDNLVCKMVLEFQSLINENLVEKNEL